MTPKSVTQSYLPSVYIYSLYFIVLYFIFFFLPSFFVQTKYQAATFEHLLTNEYRDDCLKTLPSLPLPPDGELERLLDLQVDEHARGLISVLCDLVGGEGVKEVKEEEEEEEEVKVCGAEVKTYHDFSPWVKKMWSKFIQ